MPTIKELETLLKSSEEEMLFWRHAHRDADKRVAELEAENAVMRADIAAALRINNPCGHTGFESFACEICGYPDPKKMITKLKDERDALKADNERMREALNIIASWREGPRVTSSFDEPGSAEIARQALQGGGYDQ